MSNRNRLSVHSYYDAQMKNILTLTFFLLLSACDNSNTAPESNQTLKIGALLCLSGDCAEWGQSSLRGMSIALSEVSGKDIRLVVEDSQEYIAANTVSSFRKLSSDKDIKIVIGPTWSVGGLSIAPIVSKMDMIMISPSLGMKEFNESADNLFNIWPHDHLGSEKLADYAISRDCKRAVVISSDQPWEQDQGQYFASKFESNGGSIVGLYEPLYIEPDSYKPVVTKALSLKPDCVYMSAFTNYHLILKDIRRLKYKGLILAPLADQSRINLAGELMNGVITFDYEVDEEQKEVFREKYLKIYGDDKFIKSALTGYDLIKIIEQLKLDPQNLDIKKIKQDLLGISNYQGLSGSITFDSKGGIVKTPNVYQIVDQKAQLAPL